MKLASAIPWGHLGLSSRFLWTISCPDGAGVRTAASGSIYLLGGAVEKRPGWPRIANAPSASIGGGMNNNKYIVLIVI